MAALVPAAMASFRVAKVRLSSMAVSGLTTTSADCTSRFDKFLTMISSACTTTSVVLAMTFVSSGRLAMSTAMTTSAPKSRAL